MQAPGSCDPPRSGGAEPCVTDDTTVDDGGRVGHLARPAPCPRGDNRHEAHGLDAVEPTCVAVAAHAETVQHGKRPRCVREPVHGTPCLHAHPRAQQARDDHGNDEVDRDGAEPSHIGWYADRNGTKTSRQRIGTNVSSSIVITCRARNSTVSSEMLRWRPCTTKRGIFAASRAALLEQSEHHRCAQHQRGHRAAAAARYHTVFDVVASMIMSRSTA